MAARPESSISWSVPVEPPAKRRAPAAPRTTTAARVGVSVWKEMTAVVGVTRSTKGPRRKAGSWTNHDPRRPRKLLLHRKELNKLIGKIELKGLTLIPLRLYFNQRGYAKVEIGLGKGKKLHDKRADMKRRDARREIERAMAGRGR